MVAVEPHEVRWDDVGPALQGIPTSLEQNDLVGAALPDGLDQSSAIPELGPERLGDAGEGRGDHDRVERCFFGEAGGPVADDHHRIPDPVAVQVVPRRLRQVGDPLNAEDAAGQSGE
jgi:hypothetical protein